MSAIWPDALSFDDVTIVPRHSEITPNQADVRSWFSRNVPLLVPIASAAMVDVTDSRLSIALAKCGGLGVIHKYFTIEKQADEVERTKYALNVLIERPITFHPKTTFRQILDYKAEHGFKFNSFPIVDDQGRPVGLITGHHMTYVKDRLDARVEVLQKRIYAVPREIEHVDYATILLGVETEAIRADPDTASHLVPSTIYTSRNESAGKPAEEVVRVRTGVSGIEQKLGVRHCIDYVEAAHKLVLEFIEKGELPSAQKIEEELVTRYCKK